MHQPKSPATRRWWLIGLLLLAIVILGLAVAIILKLSIFTSPSVDDDALSLTTDSNAPDIGQTLVREVPTAALQQFTSVTEAQSTSAAAQPEDTVAVHARFVSFTPASSLVVTLADGTQKTFTVPATVDIHVVDRYTLDEKDQIVGLSYGDAVGVEALTELTSGATIRITSARTSSTTASAILIYPTSQ